MKEFEVGKLGKTMIIELERGELLIESICAFLEKKGVQNAVVVSAVGSLQKLVYHRPTDFGEAANDEILEIKQPMEICSLIGAVIGGQAHFHVHASGPEEHHGGHLELGTEVMYLLEIMLVEIEDCNLERKLTPENVKKLFIKQ